jgi:hypothetical protein
MDSSSSGRGKVGDASSFLLTYSLPPLNKMSLIRHLIEYSGDRRILESILTVRIITNAVYLYTRQPLKLI